MSIPAVVMTPNADAFNVVESYYAMFEHEVSESNDVHAMDVAGRVRLRPASFESILDTMISSRQSTPQIDTFLIVVHGLHDASDNALGAAARVPPRACG